MQELTTAQIKTHMACGVSSSKKQQVPNFHGIARYFIPNLNLLSSGAGNLDVEVRIQCLLHKCRAINTCFGISTQSIRRATPLAKLGQQGLLHHTAISRIADENSAVFQHQ